MLTILRVLGGNTETNSISANVLLFSITLIFKPVDSIALEKKLFSGLKSSDCQRYLIFISFKKIFGLYSLEEKLLAAK